jgi:hypothetical protein
MLLISLDNANLDNYTYTEIEIRRWISIIKIMKVLCKNLQMGAGSTALVTDLRKTRERGYPINNEESVVGQKSAALFLSTFRRFSSRSRKPGSASSKPSYGWFRIYTVHAPI